MAPLTHSTLDSLGSHDSNGMLSDLRGEIIWNLGSKKELRTQ